eukprot:9266688-Pyramimonas_sp.AAC.1
MLSLALFWAKRAPRWAKERAPRSSHDGPRGPMSSRRAFPLPISSSSASGRSLPLPLPPPPGSALGAPRAVRASKMTQNCSKRASESPRWPPR